MVLPGEDAEVVVVGDFLGDRRQHQAETFQQDQRVVGMVRLPVVNEFDCGHGDHAYDTDACRANEIDSSKRSRNLDGGVPIEIAFVERGGRPYTVPCPVSALYRTAAMPIDSNNLPPEQRLQLIEQFMDALGDEEFFRMLSLHGQDGMLCMALERAERNVPQKKEPPKYRSFGEWATSPEGLLLLMSVAVGAAMAPWFELMQGYPLWAQLPVAFVFGTLFAMCLLSQFATGLSKLFRRALAFCNSYDRYASVPVACAKCGARYKHPNYAKRLCRYCGGPV